MFCHKIYYIEMLKYYSKQKYNAMKRKKEKKKRLTVQRKGR